MNAVLATTIQRDPAEAEEQRNNVMPSNAKMGCGYDVTGEYCSPTAVKNAIIDLGDPTRSHDMTHYKTSELVSVKDATNAASTDISESSMREFAKTFSGQFEASGGNMFFSAEIDASFDTTQTEITTTSFVKHDINMFYWKLSLEPSYLDLRDKLTESAKRAFAPGGLHGAELIKKYGTHYLSDIIVGGRASYCCTVNTTEMSKDTNLAVAARVSARMSGGYGEASGSASEQTAATSMNEHSTRKSRALGGDPMLVDGIFSQGTLEAWQKSVPDYLQFCDCTGGLVRISKLVADPARAAEIDAAIDAKLGQYKLPPEPDVGYVHAFHTDNPSRWFYSMDPNEAPRKFTKKPGKGFYALTAPRPGTVPFYRQDASDPTRFRLSKSKKPTPGGWANAVFAFHAWSDNSEDLSRKRVIECVRHDSELRKHSGYHYTNAGGAPQNWDHTPAGDFYVPKIGP